ncbi:hypothetical protein ACEPAH_2206 [Sanghuangporus vaninii]
MNPAAKYVSKKLKPLIKAVPTILHGTKDLAIKLSKLELQPGRRFFIVTGDVVAFYPNIPIRKCIDIVANMYWQKYEPSDRAKEFIQLSANPQYYYEKELELFRRCLEVGNTKLVTQFQHDLYLQLRGLAMGVADSPDLANLYGWYFEDKMDIVHHPRIPLYGRYIDDCLAIVYADSVGEALTICEQIKFDGCVIEWSASDLFQPFLDMCIYRDKNFKLQHMPYRKARNHQERIPWISHHPLDVKRGTFIGEMSRLATLSSTHHAYLEALKGLVALYVKRGYPTELVMHWLKNNITKRWTNRLSVTEHAPADVLVLKTEFNPVWNYFNATELGNTIFGYWREWLTRAEAGNLSHSEGFPRVPSQYTSDVVATRGLMAAVSDDGARVLVPDIRQVNILQKRVITSRKRTRNLLDLSSLWKNTVLLELDRRVLSNQDSNRQVSIPIDDTIARMHSLQMGESHISSRKRETDDVSDNETSYGLYAIKRRRSPGGNWWKSG